MNRLARISLPNLLLLIPFCLTAYSQQAQQPTPDIFPPTKIEAFQYQTGTILIKAFTRIGGHITRYEVVFKFVDLERFKGLLLSAKARLDAAN